MSERLWRASRDIVFDDTNETPDAVAVCYGFTSDIRVQRAALIANAVNAHDGLLAACQAEETLCEHQANCKDCDARYGEDGECSEYRRLVKELNPAALRRAAIAKAKDGAK